MTDLAFHRPQPIAVTTPDSAPHNLDAEQALLGGILFDNEVYNRVGEFLQAPHFYDPVHGRIYAVASELITKGALADGITLKSRFERDQGLEEIGGAAYLADLLDKAAPGPLALEYAKLIYDLALRRDLIRLGGEIAGDAADPETEGDARGQIESAERKLYALAEAGTTSKGFVSFERAITQSLNMAAAAYEREGHVSGISTGYKDIDAQLGGLHKSDLVILAGRPSMGKTALATNIAYNVARAYKWEPTPEGSRKTLQGGVVGFFSLEMSAEQLATRIMSQHAEVPSNNIRKGEITPAEYDKLRDAAMDLQSIPLHIDETGGLSIGGLAARARRLKRIHGLDLVVIDYLQLASGSDSRRNDNRVQEVSEITNGLKALAKELDVPVLALSQLSRQVENREDKRPQLSDLRESGSIEQDADVVMFVYREAYYLGRAEPRVGTPEYTVWQEQMAEIGNLAEVIVGKQRHGPIGTVKLAFNGAYTRFDNLAKSGRYDDYER
jgi:replicative DNA helicase